MPPSVKGSSGTAIIANVVASLLGALFCFLLVEFVGGPDWAAFGFGYVSYLVLVNAKGGVRP